MAEEQANNRVSLRDYLEQRFDALDNRLDRRDAIVGDHETRIRVIEKQSTWKWIAHIAQGVGLGLSSWFGTRP